MTRRRLLRSAAAATAGLAVAGALGTRAGLAAAPRQSSGRTAITYWTWHHPFPQENEDQHDHFKDAFEQAYPDLTFEVTVYPYPDYLTALKTAASGNTWPDILGAQEYAFTSQYVEFWEPLDARARATWGENWKDRFIPTALKLCLESDPAGQHYYIIPTEISTGGVQWYNKDLFQKVGASIPKTYDELKTTAASLRESGIIPIAWGAKDKWPNTDYFVMLAAQLAPGTFEAAQRGEAKFTDPGLVASLAFMKQMIDDRLFNESPFSATAYPEAYTMFWEKKAAMITSGLWNMGAAGFFPFPQVKPDAAPWRPWITAAYNLAIPRSSARKDEAWKLVEFSTSEAGQRLFGAWNGTAVKGVPVKSRGNADFDAMTAWHLQIAEQAVPRELRAPEIREALQTAVEDVCVGGGAPEEGMALVQAAYDRLAAR